MLLPRIHAWTRKQKWLIVASVVVVLGAFAAAVYTYERYHRGPTDSVFFGTWQMQGMCIDCDFYLTLQPDHNALGFTEAEPDDRRLDGRGRWYAGGGLLVVHYDTPEQAFSLVMHIADISPDVILVRRDGREIRMVRSAHATPSI